MSIPFIAGIVILLIIVAIAVSQRSRPRVTHIEREVRKKKDGDDA
jgi:hypothetical protein